MRELSYLPQCSPYLPKSLQNPCCGIQGGNTLSEIIILYLVRPTFSQKSSCNENIYKEFFFFLQGIVHYRIPTKVRLVKAMVFPVVMYGWM